MSSEHDKVDLERLRRNLLNLAELIGKLDEEGSLLESSPRLISIMGNLRAELFEYEVRCTGRLLPEETPPEVIEAQRIVEEAARRLEEQEDEEWWRRFSSESDDDDDDA